ncbi:methylmalonyl Co-A mutase-associated GTPase MeaB [Jatrophihabitans telluris]|uniref:Methylmalonyl Co-A mutase-associated GTPase MeaB n=1 Tax=Jatrophihabitans telluris TaxID=2038343 RepID=A0ABY4QY06_9ACTN|nr:methylmalonyl Co-A mutase-associated GTPase MeaB [Jatrophihabitans telluris]UQX87795.1 methylmalonyl Co-A mutase-associated GTPase MeaB [Jatrophihabitans telluris]
MDTPDVPAAGDLSAGIRAGDRACIARAITLVESRRADHREQAQALIAELLPATGGARRIGVTGVPGVGKSTFIDTLGMNLIDAGQSVAVLAVDPSSARTGGSILGDRTRMARLSVQDRAFVRPSPSGATLGGVARATRESLLIMEAAGYQVVLVETVGVGQSEYVVAGMVDTFLFLTLARTGDQLQAMKRGILELADVIAVNKADGAHAAEAERAGRELSSALALLGPDEEQWRPPVLTCSGRDNIGLDEVWSALQRHRAHLAEQDRFHAKRRRQLVDWTRSMVTDRLLAVLDTSAGRAAVHRAEAAVLAGELTPEQAAAAILAEVS